jgi:hypothetical protein
MEAALTHITDNLAEIIFASADPANQKPKPGRPVAIDDGRLLNTRDQLLFLFETTWDHVGGKLQWIKKPADVLETLQVWKNDNRENHYYVAQLLLRPASSAASARDLAELRRQTSEANVAQYETRMRIDEYRKALETAERALSPDLSEADKAKVQDQIARRKEKLQSAEAKHALAASRQKQVQERLQDAEAIFARSEFVRFCRSNRYELKPLNLANALAGLPFIGWRQSAIRCTKHPASGSNGMSMQIFDTIRKIADSCTRRSELIQHAEGWLREKRNIKSLGAKELQKKFYYLRWAMKAVLEAETRVTSRELPYAITREYWKRVTHPSNVDSLFEEEERIVD